MSVRSAALAGDLPFGGDGQQFGASLPKLLTGIPGFDDLTLGGLPLRRATVVAGQAGSAKTVFAGQFLAEGVRLGQPGVFVTLEEPADDLRASLHTLGFDIEAWEAQGDWRFVDASPLVNVSTEGGAVVAPYRIDTLAAQIGHAIDATGADRVVVDSLSAVLRLNDDPRTSRSLLRTLVAELRRMSVTVLFTVETPGDPGGAFSTYGVEEFVADNLILLHHLREGPVRRRTIEVLKMRGAMHHKGEVSFTVLPGQGIVVLPMVRMHTGEVEEPRRLSSGSDGLDEMLHGGVFSGSSILLSGPTGIGKTMISTQFLGAGAARGEKVLLLAFEESRDQVIRSAAGWGVDFAGYEEQGLLSIVSAYPDIASLDDHLVQIEDLLRRLQPSRVAIDSITALERLGSNMSFREFTARLTASLKRAGVTSLMTASAPTLIGGTSVTEAHVSAYTDAIVLLRYAELDSAVRRAITVLKLRGSSHETDLREYTITDQGLNLKERFFGVQGVLTGRME